MLIGITKRKKNSTKCKLIAATEKNKSQSRALDGTIKFNQSLAHCVL